MTFRRVKAPFQIFSFIALALVALSVSENSVGNIGADVKLLHKSVFHDLCNYYFTFGQNRRTSFFNFRFSNNRTHALLTTDILVDVFFRKFQAESSVHPIISILQKTNTLHKSLDDDPSPGTDT